MYRIPKNNRKMERQEKHKEDMERNHLYGGSRLPLQVNNI